MKYSKLLEILYNGELDDLLRVLNLSIYSKDVILNDDNFRVLHTGFSFEIHTGKRLDILYDLVSEKIIRQVHNNGISIPTICGIYVVRDEKKYFNSYYPFIFTDIYEDDNENAIMHIINNPQQYFSKNNITEILVFDDETKREFLLSSIKIHFKNDQIKEIPLQKKLSVKLFYGNGIFRTFDPEYTHNTEEDNDYYDRGAHRRGTNWKHYNEDLDMDQQSQDFWDQF